MSCASSARTSASIVARKLASSSLGDALPVQRQGGLQRHALEQRELGRRERRAVAAAAR